MSHDTDLDITLHICRKLRDKHLINSKYDLSRPPVQIVVQDNLEP
jgi:hypothetical protein